MARRSVKRGIAVLLAAGCLCGSPPAQANDAGALVRQMAAEPWHYGGVLRGPVDGRVLIGLDMPAGGGAVHGETMLLTGDRRLIDTGRVSGEVGAYAVPGGRDCILHLVFSDRTLTLRGVCAAASLSGEILDRSTERPGWLARQIFWWDADDTRGQAWLTAAAFYD